MAGSLVGRSGKRTYAPSVAISVGLVTIAPETVPWRSLPEQSYQVESDTPPGFIFNTQPSCLNELEFVHVVGVVPVATNETPLALDAAPTFVKSSPGDKCTNDVLFPDSQCAAGEVRWGKFHT
jgi:hypothetical protein